MLNIKIKQLLEKLKSFKKSNIPDNDPGPFLRRGHFSGAIAIFYEKVRYMVDYKDEHTIRRSAIERILKRKVLMENNWNSASSVLEEMVNGGYIPDNAIPESTAVLVQKIIDRAFLLKKFLGEKLPAGLPASAGSKLNRLPLSLAASEINAFLFPASYEAVLETFFQSVKENIRLPGDLPVGAREMKVYIACRRSLLKDDDSSLIYAIWLKVFPKWLELTTDKEIQAVANKIDTVDHIIQTHVHDSLTLQLASRLKNQSIYFSLIKEITDAHGTEAEVVLEKKELVESFVQRFLDKKYFYERKKQYQSGLRAVAYIFITKILIALALEMPYSLWMYDEIRYSALVINAVFHPILLFLIIRLSPSLGERNTQTVLRGLSEVLYGKNNQLLQIKGRRGGSFFNLIFYALYLSIFTFTFYIIISALIMLHFNIVSIILFILFLTLVSYFGLHIKNNGNNWKIRQRDDTFLQTLWGLFTMPVVQTGRWLSLKFDSANIFVLIMDFIIETPFMLVLKIYNSFFQFIKEKKDEIY